MTDSRIHHARRPGAQREWLHGLSAYSCIGLSDPFAWVASGAVKASPERRSRQCSTRATIRPLIVDTGTTFKTTSVASLAPSPNRATVRSYEAGKVSIDLVTPATAGSLLVLSENYIPWLDGDIGFVAAARLTRELQPDRRRAASRRAQHIEASFLRSQLRDWKDGHADCAVRSISSYRRRGRADRRRSEPGAVGV